MKKLHKTEALEWRVFLRFIGRMQNEIGAKGRAAPARIAMGSVVSAYTGLRFSEMASLRWGMLLQMERMVVTIKGGGTRNVKFAGFVRGFAEFCYENTPVQKGDLILSSRTGELMTLYYFNKTLGQKMMRHGIKTTNGSSQMLRKTYALRVFEYSGNSMESLRSLGVILNHRGVTKTLQFIGKTRQDVVRTRAYFE